MNTSVIEERAKLAIWSSFFLRPRPSGDYLSVSGRPVVLGCTRVKFYADFELHVFHEHQSKGEVLRIFLDFAWTWNSYHKMCAFESYQNWGELSMNRKISLIKSHVRQWALVPHELPKRDQLARIPLTWVKINSQLWRMKVTYSLVSSGSELNRTQWKEISDAWLAMSQNATMSTKGVYAI